MTKPWRALAALFLALAPAPLAAQAGDAFVLPQGMLRLRLAGEYTRFDSRFAASGSGSEAVTADLLAPLTSRAFAPLAPLETQLNAFFAATAGDPVTAGPQNYLLGTPDLEAALSTRYVPLGLDLGVHPGLEVGITVPLQRQELIFTRTGLAGGTLGANPAPAANATLLRRIGPEWEALGRAALLPTDSSALGRALQSRVRAVTGSPIDLPAGPADFETLQGLVGSELGVDPLSTGATPWRLGDAEVTARYRFRDAFAGVPYPTGLVGRAIRATASLTLRLPTGSEPDTVRLLSALPEAGFFGVGVGVDADVFQGERFWGTVTASYRFLLPTDVQRRVSPLDQPLVSPEPPTTVRWSPGGRLAVRVAPRYRLTDAIALGGSYALLHQGGSSFEGASALDLEGGLLQRVGLGARYSTLPAWWEGRRLVPIEVVLAYEATLTGPARAPRTGSVLLQANLFRSLWGTRE